MFNRDSKDITTGDNTNVLQANNVIIHNGLSYTEAKDLINELFKSNFIVLKQEAARIAEERAQEMAEKVLNKVKESPDALNEFANPAMQHAFFNAQKEYAMSGDKDLGDMLVEILVERAKTPTRDLTRLILDECLLMAPKLTTSQMDLLTLLFLTLKVGINKGTPTNFINLINTYWKPLIDDFDFKDKDLSFLEYFRILKLDKSINIKFDSVFRAVYPSFFMNGFSLDTLKSHANSSDLDFSKIIIPCYHDSNKFQFNCFNDEDLLPLLNTIGIQEDRITYVASLYRSNVMKDVEINSYCIRNMPFLDKLNHFYNTTSLQHYDISAVGLSIGIANFERKFGHKLNIRTYID